MSPFAQVWCVDFEFKADPGERPVPVCMVARELYSGDIIRLGSDDFGPEPPFPIGKDILFVAYLASAELNCFRALGWPMPYNVIDLFVEFRLLTNGVRTVAGNGLLGALAAFGLDHIDIAEKKEMQALAMRGGPYTDDERVALLDYCQSDVDALIRLLPVMTPRINLRQALLRGRYMIAVSAMEHNGVPIDTNALDALRQNWTSIKDKLVADIDADYHVIKGHSINRALFENFLSERNIPWPRLESGLLDLKDETLHEMARCYPIISPLAELHHSLGSLKLFDLEVGADGRNRRILSPFGSRTGRNQPSNTRFVFGPATWIRGLIRPPPGYGLAYVDWSQQEFGIAAALSGDLRMQNAYQSGDPYLGLAKQSGLVPLDATKESHGPQRELCKLCILGTQYGMGPYTLAQRIGRPPIVARDLLQAHRDAYPVFWRWSEGALNTAKLRGSLSTVLGWRINVGVDCNPRSLCNFPCQANGAEILRVACCLGIERGVEICAPVHDAVLITAPLERLDADIAIMQEAMAEASRIVLDGFELRSEAKIVRYPDRYMDKRGIAMWETVWKLINSDAATRKVA
jgi:hypothetical protein